MILRSTAQRFRGKCAPCAKKKWYQPLVDAPIVLGWLAVWPFLATGFVIVGAYWLVARCVPGTRQNLKAKLERGWLADWATIKRMWSRARGVYAGPIGPGAEMTLEYLMLRQLTLEDAIPSSQIQEAIGTGNAVLTAYCALALVYRGEVSLVRSLPDDVLQSEEALFHQVGCIGCWDKLGDFLKAQLDQVA